MQNNFVNPYIKLTEETLVINKHVLHRIVCTQDFDEIKAGQVGGWVESIWSVRNRAWVGDEAVVYEGAYLYEHARVYENAVVKSEASVYGSVYGNAIVCKGAYIDSKSAVYGNVIVTRCHLVGTKVYDEACVSGSTKDSDRYCSAYNS